MLARVGAPAQAADVQVSRAWSKACERAGIAGLTNGFYIQAIDLLVKPAKNSKQNNVLIDTLLSRAQAAWVERLVLRDADRLD